MSSSTPQSANIVLASDFRYPGGTSHSIAEEVRAQVAAGIVTHLMHVPRAGARPAPWSEAIQSLLTLPNVHLISRYERVHIRLLVFRHPLVLETAKSSFDKITADQVLIVANQAATDAHGNYYYDAQVVDRKVTEHFGVRPIWAPIGPVVRAGLIEQTGDLDLLHEDWVNIFTTPLRSTPRAGVSHNPPVIGRHSRPSQSKWPETSVDLLAAYPESSRYQVKILGGADPAEVALGYLPSTWTVLPFGEQDPHEFVADVDFWVFFHHSAWREAFGRAIMEALASGAVAILPSYLEQLFGNAALYCEPAEVQELVDFYTANPERYAEQSSRAINFVAKFGAETHLKRLKHLAHISASVEVGPLEPPTRVQPVSIAREKKAGNALFITSNGSGIGHLTRLLSVARALPEEIQPVFASLSSGVGIVSKFSFPYEYVPSWNALNSRSKSWNETYLGHRLGELISRLDPLIVVFDGTVPYSGFLRAVQDGAVPSVWVRRGMWKKEESRDLDKVSARFDRVIEPGEYAADYDEGLTTYRADASRVNPIILLQNEEALNRSTARHELGYGQTEKLVLVTLGAGQIDNLQLVQKAITEWFTQREPHWKLVFTRHPVAGNVGSSAYRTISKYPLFRYLNAFDIAISACGYNSFHELMSLRIPTLWLPNRATQIDDQVARARWAHDVGCGISWDVDREGTLSDALRQVVDENVLSQMKSRMARLPAPVGAEQAANLIVDTI